MAHSKLSPSKWDKYIVCPGAAAAEAPYERKDSAASLFGTQCHALLEVCLINNSWVAKEQTLYLYDADGETLILSSEFDSPDRKTARETWIMTREHTEVVNPALLYLKKRMDELSQARPAALRSESKVDCGPLIGRTDVAGTADVIMVSGDSLILEVWDLKGGRGFVPADTKQLIAYGAGALLQYRRPDGSYPFDFVRLTICQPRAESDSDQEPGIRWVEMTPTELEAKAIEAGALLARCDEADAPRTPGPHCRDKFCAAWADCPEYQQYLGAEAGPFREVVVSLPPLVPTAVEKLKSEPLPFVTTERLEALYEGWSKIKALGEAIEKELEYRVGIGMSTRYKMVEGRSVREWDVDSDTLNRRLRKFGLVNEDFLEVKMRSPAQIEKHPRIRDLDERAMERFKSLIRKVPGKPKLAPMDSPKPAIQIEPPSDRPTRYIGGPKPEPEAVGVVTTSAALDGEVPEGVEFLTPEVYFIPEPVLPEPVEPNILDMLDDL